jgi:predicted nucleic acid-binding protein
MRKKSGVATTGVPMSPPISDAARVLDAYSLIAYLLSTLPIQFVPVDMELAKKAAELKTTTNMSYADCFAAALAKLRKAELVTGDKEFKQVEGEVRVLWIV